MCSHYHYQPKYFGGECGIRTHVPLLKAINILAGCRFQPLIQLSIPLQQGLCPEHNRDLLFRLTLNSGASSGGNCNTNNIILQEQLKVNNNLAEAVRFELTDPFGSTVFKTVAINRTLPHFLNFGLGGKNRTCASRLQDSMTTIILHPD